MKLQASLLLALTVAAAPAGAAHRRWRAEPSGVTFELTAAGLSAWVGDPKGEPVFSTAALNETERKAFDKAVDELARALLEPGATPYGEPIAYEDSTLELLSVVGPLLVYREAGIDSTPGAWHPERWDTLHVLDLSRKDAEPSLLDFFSEKQLVAALKGDPWLRKLAGGTADFKRAATLDELAPVLGGGVGNLIETGDCESDLRFSAGGLATQFAFHHVAGDKVAVRIFVQAASEFCTRAGAGRQIGLLLPIPASLRSDLLKAQSGEAGLLAANAKAAGAVYERKWEVDVNELAETLRKQKK